MIVLIIKVVLLTLYIAFMGQVVFYPIQNELHKIVEFLEQFEVTIDEKDDTIE